MGGQACVIYGAAEFSRDTDLAILAEPQNLNNLQAALDELKALRIAVPPLDLRYLEMGLAVHFRCQRDDCLGMRIDLMSRMRGLAPFGELWTRRTTLQADEGPIEVLSLPDLVKAKKTQRDKDWPMIARLLEASYFGSQSNASPQQISFWLRELRTPQLLKEVVRDFPVQASAAVSDRPLLAHVIQQPDERTIRGLLHEEEEAEREADRQYWLPLRAELESLRREARMGK
jgi:hypothetical protein